MKYTVTTDDGRTVAVTASEAAHAACRAGTHWHPARTVIHTDTAAPNVYNLTDSSTGAVLDRATVTPYRPARLDRRAEVIIPRAQHACYLDEPTVTTLRALGGGNLSLGIRRAAALIGGHV